MLLSGQETVASSEYGPMGQPHVMLFSPWYYGHHATYLRHLIHYWNQQRFASWPSAGQLSAGQLSADQLSIVVMPTFLTEHPDVVALAEASQTVQFVPMTDEEQVNLESTRSNIANALVQYRLIVQYAQNLQATQCLLTHLDSCQLPFVLGLKLPCPFSGIYFRLTFHYTQFANYQPTWRERVQHLRERLFLSRLLAHPQLQTLFCLDPLAIDPINRQAHQRARAAYLPDPVESNVATEQDIHALKHQLGIEPGRKALLAFGALAQSRKGTQQLLDALHGLEPDLGRQVCLLLVGEPAEDGQAILKEWLSTVPDTLPVQIVTRFGYVPEADVSRYFGLADAVVAPYQKHPGMSGILLQAARAGRPILSSNYGLMGELVKQYRLGIAVDTTVPAEIAKGLSQLLSQPVETLCDFAQMQTLVELNSTDQFASTIFQHLYEN